MHNVCKKTYVGKSGTTKYVVGEYKDVKGIPGMDAHHVGQAAILKNKINNYNYNEAPAISVPVIGHRKSGDYGIVSRTVDSNLSPRQVLARDIKELRRVYRDIPNEALKRLIDINKQMYPEMRR